MSKDIIPVKAGIQLIRKRSPFKTFFLIFGLLLLSGCAYMLVQHGQIQQTLTEKVKQLTTQERGLYFKAPVSIEFSYQDQTKKLLRSMIERDYSPEELSNLQKAFYALGLVSEMDPKIEEVIDLYAQQAAGFYDPVTKKLYLTDWLNKKDFFMAMMEFVVQKDLSGELLLSHELTHALQDQHFDLEKFVMEDKHNLDLIIARHAVAEGEATAVAFNVIVGPMGKTVQNTPNLPRLIQKEATRFGSSLGNLSPIVREQLLFPYYGGLEFVREALVSGGWDAVTAIYQDPPRSTEQILHPEKYLKIRDNPKPLTPLFLDFLKSDLSFITSNTLGELGVRVLLSQWLSKKEAEIAAEGWGNDQYWIWEKQNSKPSLAYVWLTHWDSSLDAKEFFESFFAASLKKYKKEDAVWRHKKNNFVQGSFRHGKTLFLKQEDARVIVVEGFQEKLAEKIISNQ